MGFTSLLWSNFWRHMAGFAEDTLGGISRTHFSFPCCSEPAEGVTQAFPREAVPQDLCLGHQKAHLCIDKGWPAALGATGLRRCPRRAPGPRSFQRNERDLFSSSELRTSHWPAGLPAQGTADGLQPHSQSGGSARDSGLRHPSQK